MRSKTPTALIVLTLIAWQWPTNTAARQDTTKLLAPTYPGALLVPYHNDQDPRESMNRFGVGTPAFTDQTRTFLSKDPMDVVRAFYDGEIGPLENGSLEYLRVPEGMRSETMKPGPYVYARPLGRNKFTDFIGVEIHAIEPREERSPHLYDAVGPIFERLSYGQASGQATKAQFDELVEEYKHLAWMFYPPSDQLSSRGRRLMMDQVAYGTCGEEAGGGLSQEELAEKIQELGRQGRIREMQALIAQLMGSAGASSSGWDIWVDCLKKVEAEAYWTLITIHLAAAAVDGS
ncbi:MAG: hypothetical protein IIB90_08660 [Gemmatimonadetes bacterium]|nr:hypothetical protein [Gemmatimonadota bacterium]